MILPSTAQSMLKRLKPFCGDYEQSDRHYPGADLYCLHQSELKEFGINERDLHDHYETFYCGPDKHRRTEHVLTFMLSRMTKYAALPDNAVQVEELIEANNAIERLRG